MDYVRAMKFQQIIHSERVNNFREDTIIILEHPNTITLGRRSDQSHIITPKRNLEDSGFSIVTTDRGGQATFHGPGQLIIYPIISIKEQNFSPVSYVRFLEDIIISSIKKLGVQTRKIEGETGVWVDTDKNILKKIASIGVKFSNGVTLHGLALNVSTELKMFRHIIPCGEPDSEFTNLNIEINNDISVKDVSNLIIKEICSYLRKTNTNEHYDFSNL